MGLLSRYFDDNDPQPNDGPDAGYLPHPPPGGPPSIVTPPPGPTTPPPAKEPDPVVTGRGGRGGGGSGGASSGWPGTNFGPVPVFTPPDFNAPTFQDALNEPGYQFRSQAGMDALQGAAASKGLLRTGGTLKDLASWNQGFAAQEYGNVFNRALSAYDRKYQGSHDAFAPKLSEWQTLSNAELQRALAQYNQQFQRYMWDNPHNGGGGSGIPQHQEV